MFLKKITLITICIFHYFISVPVYAFEQGLLWQVTSPNGAKNKLFGTMHLIDKDMVSVFNLITPHVTQSRIVYIEYILDKTNASFISDNLINTKIDIKNRLSAQDLLKLKQFFRENDIHFEHLRKASPSLIYSYLINPGSMHSLQIDFKIADLAHKQAIPVKGLEEARYVFERMLSLDNTFFILALKNALLNIDALPLYREKVKSLYLNEDLNGILHSVNDKEIAESINKAFVNSLLNERNITMFNNAQIELEKGGTFIAVGAAHLGGEQGLLTLLKNAGYQITRLDLGKLK